MDLRSENRNRALFGGRGLARWGRSTGQASVEFLGALPAVIAVALMAWQLVLAGHTAWMTSNAARVAARAEAVGSDPGSAARSALPDHLERELQIRTIDAPGGNRQVRVRVRVPLVLHRWKAPLKVVASAGLPQQLQ